MERNLSKRHWNSSVKLKIGEHTML